MQNAMKQEASLEHSPAYINRVLVVDDSQPEKFRLAAMLKKMGYEVLEASDGLEALELLRHQQVAVVLSDWMMPGMSGIELCRKVREEDLNNPYFILVTGRDTTSDLVAGMDSGADDFIAKPFNGEELLVRLRAGQRTIEMRYKLESQSVELKKHIDRQERFSEQTKKDLLMASEILSDHLPENLLNQPNLNIYGFLKSANDIGGDFYNYFKLDDNHVGFYSLDVVGHGVPAALFAFMLARTIVPGESLLMKNDRYVRPSEVTRALNNKFLNKSSTPQYFTMIYGVINMKTGKGQLCQAGSPYAILARQDGTCEKLGDGGYPVGIIPGAEYEDINFELSPGSRLLLYSDGLTEMENKSKEQLGLDRLKQVFMLNIDRPLNTAVQTSYDIVKKWADKDIMNDDISMLALEVPVKDEK
jgi:sigma-B regulation protein RsbU (phosphoserine phosphatase)